jgi:hypothetical protein
MRTYGALTTAFHVYWVVRKVPRIAFYFTQSATTGFIASVFPSRSRVSCKKAFAGLELCDWKLSCTVLRGLDTDLRRYGRRLCERGGKNAKKRAAVAFRVLNSWLLGLASRLSCPSPSTQPPVVRSPSTRRSPAAHRLRRSPEVDAARPSASALLLRHRRPVSALLFPAKRHR